MTTSASCRPRRSTRSRGRGTPRRCAARRERAPEPIYGDAPDVRTELAGYVVAWLAADEAEIANLAVAPSLRGLGVGAALLDASLREVARRGASAVYLEVRESNVAARGLYA